MDKHDLLNEFFVIKGNYERDKVYDAHYKLSDYIEEKGDDPHVKDVLCILDLWMRESKFVIISNNKFYIENYNLASHTVGRLTDATEWDIYDVSIVAYMVLYVSTYNHACELASRALLRMEDFDDGDVFWPSIKLVLHTSMVYRLLRAKLLEAITDYEAAKLKEMFMFHFKAAIDICSTDVERYAYNLTLIAPRLSIFLKENKPPRGGSSTELIEFLRVLQCEIIEFEHLARSGAGIGFEPVDYRKRIKRCKCMPD